MRNLPGQLQLQALSWWQHRFRGGDTGRPDLAVCQWTSVVVTTGRVNS